MSKTTAVCKVCGHAHALYEGHTHAATHTRVHAAHVPVADAQTHAAEISCACGCEKTVAQAGQATHTQRKQEDGEGGDCEGESHGHMHHYAHASGRDDAYAHAHKQTQSCCSNGDTAHGEYGCGCGHAHSENELHTVRAWLPIFLGTALIGTGYLLEGIWHIAVCLMAYVLLGGPVLLQAWKDIRNGQIFGECFLMGIATLGAFMIGEYTEAVAVMLFYRIGEYFQHRAVDHSRRSIQEVINLRPEFARIQRAGIWVTVDPALVRVGDEMLVNPGERIPVDGIVRDGDSRVDNSMLTGESVPEHAKAGKTVLAGGINQTGPLHIEVIRPLSESASCRIMRAVEDAATGKPKLENFITRFSKIYTPIVVGLAVLLAVVPPILGAGTFSQWAYRALMFLVISCPCALVLSVPLTFFAGLARSSKRGILFKGANRMEALSGVKAAVFDKTGTLTHGVFEVQEIHPENGFTNERLLFIAAAAEHHSLHPMAKAIRDAAGTYTPAEHVEELAGRGVSAMMDGKRIYVGNAQLLQEKGITIPMLLQGTVAYVAWDDIYVGCIIIADSIKPDSAATIATLNRQVGYTAILTGDAEEPAMRIAELTGTTECFFKLLPEEKLTAMQRIRKERGAVLFVGDGINDAPVLMGADVGIAIGGSGTDMAVEAADVVLLGADMMAVPEAIQISKRTISIARQNIVFAIAIKAIVMLLGAFGLASMWMAVFADVGTAMVCVLNALRLLPARNYGHARARDHGKA